MTYEEAARLTFVQGRIVAATIIAQGMTAENNQRMALGQSMAYTEKDFTDLLGEYSLHHNALLTEIHGQ